MSRICGIVSPNLKREELAPILNKMTHLMQHEDRHRLDAWFDQGIGLGHSSIGAVNEEVQPLTSRDGRFLIITAGKIVGYGDLKAELMKKGCVFQYPHNDAEFVLNLYQEYGTAKFGELNGIFAFAIWDQEKRELMVVNDRYGLRPLYYYFDASKRVFLFGSELKTITKQTFVDKQVNWDAWNVFLRLGFLVGEDTFYQNIMAMPQGSILKFHLDSIKIENYWNYGMIHVKESFEEKEDIDNLVFLFRQAIKRRIVPDKKAAVFLSGGGDSRGIVAELKRQNVSFTSYTTRKFHPIDYDRKIAAKVAEVLQIENVFCDLPDDFLETVRPPSDALLDFESEEHAWMLPLINHLPNDVKINYDGLAQDILCDEKLYADYNRPYAAMLHQGKYEDWIKQWYATKSNKLLKWPFAGPDHNFTFFSKVFRQKFSNDQFISKLKSELLKYEGNENFYLYFYLNGRTRREISLSIYGLILNKAETFCPYLDNDYFEYLMSLPINAKEGRHIRKKILDRAYPELSEIDTDSTLKNKTLFEVFHHDFHHQRLNHLLKMEKELCRRMNQGIYNPFYLLPRFLSDLFLIKCSGKAAKEQYLRSHHWLVFPLYFMDRWLQTEGDNGNAQH